MLQKKDNRAAGELEGAKAPLEMKTCFHKKCGVFEACKKVKDFFDTLRIYIICRC